MILKIMKSLNDRMYLFIYLNLKLILNQSITLFIYKHLSINSSSIGIIITSQLEHNAILFLILKKISFYRSRKKIFLHFQLN